MGCEAPHLRAVLLRFPRMGLVRAWVFDVSACMTLQGGLVLWYPLSPDAASWFVSSAPSVYLAGVIACLTYECLAPSFIRHLTRQATTNNNTSAYTIVKHPVRVTRAEPKAPPASSSRPLGPYCLYRLLLMTSWWLRANWERWRGYRSFPLAPSRRSNAHSRQEVSATPPLNTHIYTSSSVS